MTVSVRVKQRQTCPQDQWLRSCPAACPAAARRSTVGPVSPTAVGISAGRNGMWPVADGHGANELDSRQCHIILQLSRCDRQSQCCPRDQWLRCLTMLERAHAEHCRRPFFLRPGRSRKVMRKLASCVTIPIRLQWAGRCCTDSRLIVCIYTC